MQRVNWEAKSDYEYIQNYKLLQVAFTKNRVQRHIDVDKLIRAKYQGEQPLFRCLSTSLFQLLLDTSTLLLLLFWLPLTRNCRQLGILPMAKGKILGLSKLDRNVIASYCEIELTNDPSFAAGIFRAERRA